MALAVNSLLLAGCFSLLLVFGRVPGLAEAISDAQFFKRCLVLHVDLALIVWFFAFAAALYALLPGTRVSNTVYRAGFYAAAVGVLTMIVGTMVPNTAPVLANYVPVIDNPIYVTGIALFFGGLLVCFINGRLFSLVARSVPSVNSVTITPEVASGLKATALAYLVAVTTFAISWAITPRGIDPRTYYELVFWGGGHVLQVANVAAMMSVWLLMLSSLLKREIFSPGVARILFGLLIAPHFIAPLLTIDGTVAGLYRVGFTRLMQFGIFPVVTIVLLVCTRRLWVAWRNGELSKSDLANPRFIGFAASAALTITGFLMGASIRNSNTMIPAHYHASIGAVTVAFMAMIYVLLKPLGLALPSVRLQRLIPWQLYLFGAGQVIFAIGFAFGGLHGLGRKAYSAEQHIRSAGELIGIGVMGLGGLIAIVGGLLFLLLAVCTGKRFQAIGTAVQAAARALKTLECGDSSPHSRLATCRQTTAQQVAPRQSADESAHSKHTPDFNPRNIHN